MPETSDNYVHRVGRTGRGREKGQAVSFCSEEEKYLLTEIEENLGKPIQKIDISKGDYKTTLEITGEKVDDWQSLMKEADEFETSRRSGSGKGKKKKRK